MIHGVINIHKEKGYTSHDVVAKLRGIVGQKKIGHTGTLDPDATGVLPVCFGKATKLCDMAVQVTLTDEDCGGTFYFKKECDTIIVEGYDYYDNDAVIDIERKVFMDILSGRKTLDNAVLKGKAVVKGDLDKLATLKDAIGEYKAPVRKTTKVKK